MRIFFFLFLISFSSVSYSQSGFCTDTNFGSFCGDTVDSCTASMCAGFSSFTGQSFEPLGLGCSRIPDGSFSQPPVCADDPDSCTVGGVVFPSGSPECDTGDDSPDDCPVGTSSAGDFCIPDTPPDDDCDSGILVNGVCVDDPADDPNNDPPIPDNGCASGISINGVCVDNPTSSSSSSSSTSSTTTSSTSTSSTSSTSSSSSSSSTSSGSVVGDGDGDGDGDGEDEGSAAVGSGSCGTPPSCEGDVFACAQLRQDYNILCGATVSDTGDCGSFSCSGNPLECEQLRLANLARCENTLTDSQSNDPDSLENFKQGIDDGANFEGGDGVDGSEIDLDGVLNDLDDSGFGFSSSCFRDFDIVHNGRAFTVELSRLCIFLDVIRWTLLIISSVISISIIMRAF